MTIHPDISRALVQHGGNFQDALRETWMASIPRHLRRQATQSTKLNTIQQQEAGRLGVATVQAQAKARRAVLLPQIAALLAQGLRSEEISREIGVPARSVRNLMKELRS